jgi:hypothetical protein
MILLSQLRLEAEWERAPEAKVADLPEVGPNTICRQHPCVKGLFTDFSVCCLGWGRSIR